MKKFHVAFYDYNFENGMPIKIITVYRDTLETVKKEFPNAAGILETSDEDYRNYDITLYS